MITLQNGDVLRFNCTFFHRGKAFIGARLYAAIGKKGLTFDELKPTTGITTVSGIQDDAVWAAYQVSVDVPISQVDQFGGPSSAQKYEAYVKLIDIPGADIFWYGPLNDIAFLAPLGEAEFADLSVSYAKA